MNKRYLLSFDFDRTIADTFKKGPRGIGVNEATEYSVRDILGKAGLEQLHKLGGLNNRAPSELVYLIFKSDRATLTENAKSFFDSNVGGLSKMVPEAKGVPLVWDEKNIIQLVSELFVRQKLSYLLGQIGEKTVDGQLWPPLTKGFLEFWSDIQKLKEEGVPIDTAIISSGHDVAIDKVFRLYNLKRADIIVSEDDIRGKKYPEEMARRVKPGELPLALAHQEWLEKQGMNHLNFDLKIAAETKERMMYFGDDPNKDGKLAQRANIPYGFIVPENLFLMEKDNASTFKDWSAIGNLIRHNRRMFLNGESFRNILNTERMNVHPEIK